MYLEEAAKGVDAMIRLEKEAKKLGLETTCRPGELERMESDIEVKIKYLKRHRNKRQE
jgi:hypothetical protein